MFSDSFRRRYIYISVSKHFSFSPTQRPTLSRLLLFVRIKKKKNKNSKSIFKYKNNNNRFAYFKLFLFSQGPGFYRRWHYSPNTFLKSSGPFVCPLSPLLQIRAYFRRAFLLIIIFSTFYTGIRYSDTRNSAVECLFSRRVSPSMIR